MIHSTNNSNPLGRMENLGGTDHSKKAPEEAAAKPSSSDALSVGAAAALRSDLEALPVTRSEKVEAAKALIVSPNYPPAEIIRRISELLVSTPDLSSEL